ncbi:MAG: hypothetical protein GZ090_01530 [Oxalobacteraceae bacterium]|nr:hypothetical protein [Oxalobacteraceae bacterium]
MKLSKEQKEALAIKLSIPWGSVDLQCDGNLVQLRVERFKAMSYRVMTYVNGEFKGIWCLSGNAAPEAKFLRKSVRPTVSPAKRKEMEKKFGKRFIQKDPFWSGSVTIYLPDFSSGKAALNHLCKVCESVELVENKIDMLANNM